MIVKKRHIDPNKPKIRLPAGREYVTVKEIVKSNHLHTICESGNCPNISQCWANGTATFMILGDICTRSCRFCSVKTGKPAAPDTSEPENIARSVKLMNLRHCVITSVDRDDLPDGGSIIWAETVNKIRELSPGTTIETLIPDFKGVYENIRRVIDVRPEIVSHNLETIRRLTGSVRIQARYDSSLDVLRILNEHGITTKTGIMTGLGETMTEIKETMQDVYATGCRIFTAGQYLQPDKNCIPVTKFYSEDEFREIKETGLSIGFKIVESGSLIRSSFNAEKHLTLI
ncbi:MAG: lipoyl synthase [Bacteroidota bacterium]